MATNSTPTAEGGGQAFEWSEALHAWIFRARIFLKRYWWIFLLTVAAGVGLRAYHEYERVPVYQSGAQMILRGRMIVPQGASYVDELSNFYATTEALLQGHEVGARAQEIVQALHPDFKYAPPVAISADQMNGANIISLAAVSTDKLYTQYYLDAVMQAYLNFKQEERQETMDYYSNQMMDKVETYQKQMDEDEKAIVAFETEHNMISVQEQSEEAGKREAELESNLATEQAQLRLLETAGLDEYIAGQDVESVDHWLLGPDGIQTPDPDYLRAKVELQKLNAQKDSYAEVLRPAHPKMLALEDAIANVENELQVQRREIVEQLRDHRSAMEAEVAHLKDDILDAQKRALEFSELAAEFSQLQQQLDIATKTHDQLLTEVRAIDVQSGMDEGMLKVMDPASDAMEINANPAKEIGEGAFAGLVAGAALIFILGLLDGRVMSVEDVSQRFDEPMLGIIPMQRRVSGQVELLKSNDQRLMFAESCRNIRSSLLYMDHLGQRPRMIVVTSSIPGEGKSTISANLAITLGFASSKTLLVDADLRRGQLYKRFGLKNDIGLAEHIQGGVPIDQVIQPTGLENLDMIATGQYPAHPGELLMSDRFRETMVELRKRYDFVVFDSPPIMATDDAASFATRTDAVIFVVRAGHTRLRQIRSSLEGLHRRGVRIYGIIVNFIDHREPSYYSYKYYDYYSYKVPERPPERK
jgi:capsular exopolysaccharide synthesis family protein